MPSVAVAEGAAVEADGGKDGGDSDDTLGPIGELLITGAATCCSPPPIAWPDVCSLCCRVAGERTEDSDPPVSHFPDKLHFPPQVFSSQPAMVAAHLHIKHRTGTSS